MSKKTDLWAGIISDDVDIRITILPELKELIPSLSPEEKDVLKQSLLDEGCREPLLLWKNGEENILIDGHNRYEICEEFKIRYQTNFKSFDNFEAVKNWMIVNQLGRRNLGELQKSYLRGLQYSREKKGLGGDRKSEKSKGQNDLLNTAEKLAQEHQVSEKTIKRDEKFALGIDKLTEGNKEAKDKILNKQIKIPQSIIQDASDWDKKKIEKAKRDIESGNIANLASYLEETGKKIDRTKQQLLELENHMKEIQGVLVDKINGASPEELLTVIKALKLDIETLIPS